MFDLKSIREFQFAKIIKKKENAISRTFPIIRGSKNNQRHHVVQ